MRNFGHRKILCIVIVTNFPFRSTKKKRKRKTNIERATRFACKFVSIELRRKYYYYSHYVYTLYTSVICSHSAILVLYSYEYFSYLDAVYMAPH